VCVCVFSKLYENGIPNIQTGV